MNKQWIGTAVFVVCIAVGPFLATALWRRGVSRPLGYAAGFALIILGAITARLLAGFPTSTP